MKLKNVKHGVRVEVKANTKDDRVPVFTKGTILQSDDAQPFIEWDNFTDGHSGGNPSVPDSVWAVHIEYLRRVKD